MFRNIFLNSSQVLALSLFSASFVLSSQGAAQEINNFGSRTVLCVKRVGEKIGSANRGRDAYLNPNSCPRGYYSIDLNSLKGATISSAGPKGPAGPQGPSGPQGLPGLIGGSITGRLVNCTPVGEPVTSACEAEMQKLYEMRSRSELQVYIPGESFDSYVNRECRFRLSHVPAGIFDILVNGGFESPKPFGIENVVVNEGKVTDLGDIALCYDYDGDGSNQLNDCNDDNPIVRPGAIEICEDQIDNDCDESVDEGCPEPTPTPVSESTEVSPLP